MLTTFLREAGVSLRESGGVYFVPATHQATLDALCAVVEAAGNNQTFLLPIVDSVEGKKTLRKVAKRSLDDEIRQLHEELQRFDREKVRESTLQRKLDGFDELRSRVNLFARVLSFKADSLNNKISGIQSALRGELNGTPAPAPTPIRPAPQPSAAEPLAADVGF